MKFLLRPLSAIITLTITLLLLSLMRILFSNGEAVEHLEQSNASIVVNEAGHAIAYFHHDEYSIGISSTEALEIVGLARLPDHYRLSLKNISDKNIVAYSLSAGYRDIEVDGGGYGHRQTTIASGETYQDERLKKQNLDNSGFLTIRVVVFDDDSFEGDINLAAQIIARREGIRIQAAPVLDLIDHTLKADDENLLGEFDELEAQIGILPEAIDKEAALELLRSKYSCFDKSMIRSLYERLKWGLYEGKNMAHSPIGNLQRDLKRQKESSTIQAEAIRERLNEIKKNFEKVSRK